MYGHPATALPEDGAAAQDEGRPGGEGQPAARADQADEARHGQQGRDRQGQHERADIGHLDHRQAARQQEPAADPGVLHPLQEIALRLGDAVDEAEPEIVEDRHRGGQRDDLAEEHDAHPVRPQSPGQQQIGHDRQRDQHPLLPLQEGQPRHERAGHDKARVGAIGAQAAQIALCRDRQQRDELARRS